MCDPPPRCNAAHSDSEKRPIREVNAGEKLRDTKAGARVKMVEPRCAGGEVVAMGHGGAGI